MTETRRRLPNSAALTDDPADLSTSLFTPMGPDGIISELVNASGDPQAGTLVPRFGTEGLCETCLGSPNQPAPAETHPYHPVAGRTPGVHGSIDDPGRAPRNFNPATDGPGQAQANIIGDEELDSGRAEARWNQATSRQREGQWPR
jgi:hypothetical protein